MHYLKRCINLSLSSFVGWRSNVDADERNPQSEGFALALEYSVEAAPFFIVEQEDGSKAIYTAYGRFLKDVFNHEISETKQALEILSQNPDLDFI